MKCEMPIMHKPVGGMPAQKALTMCFTTCTTGMFTGMAYKALFKMSPWQYSVCKHENGQRMLCNARGNKMQHEPWQGKTGQGWAQQGRADLALGSHKAAYPALD